jgi:hypothetical protein
MPAEPPRATQHQVQHLLLDGLRILRARSSQWLDEEALAGLDRAIAELEPMEGFPIEPAEARLYGLAHGLRTLVDDIVPHVAGPPVDPSEFLAALRRVEEQLKKARDVSLATRSAR